MNAADITALLQRQMPDAEIHVEDTRGDGRHFTVAVVSAGFEGHSRIQQHQMVYKALGACVGEEVHALQIITRSPTEAAPVQQVAGG